MTVTIPEIETTNLILRGPRVEDHPDLCAYYSDPRSVWNGGPLTEVECWRVLMATAGQWQMRGHGLWYAIRRADDRFVGFSGIFHPADWPEPELGWGVTAEVEGTGIAFEAAMAARCGCARYLGLNRLISLVAPDNRRSRALAERMGASVEGTMTCRETQMLVYRHPLQPVPTRPAPYETGDA